MSSQAVSEFRFNDPGHPILFFKVIDHKVYLCTSKPGLSTDLAISKAYQLEQDFNPFSFVAHLAQKPGLILALPPDFNKDELIKAVFAFHLCLKEDSRATHNATLGTLRL